MAGQRLAVLIGNGTFPDEPGLPGLRCPAQDARGLAALLGARDRGGFEEPRVLVDRPHHEVARAIQEVLHEASGEDLVLLYFSGHGKLNRRGKLHLAAANTSLRALESTSVPLSAVREFVDVSSCRRVVLLLDCCYSGAAGDAFVTKGDVQGELQIASGGRGTYIMTASTGTEVAHERAGDEHSVFTKHVLDGIASGRADADGDGWITVDELFDHVRREVTRETGQEPTKWGFDVRGDLIVARSGAVPGERDAPARAAADPGAARGAPPSPPVPSRPPVAPGRPGPANPAESERTPGPPIPSAGTEPAGAPGRLDSGKSGHLDPGEPGQGLAARSAAVGALPRARAEAWMRRALRVQLAFLALGIVLGAFAWAFLGVSGKVTRSEMFYGYVFWAGPVLFLSSFVLGLLGLLTPCRPALLQGWVHPWIALAAVLAGGMIGATGGTDEAVVNGTFVGVVLGCGAVLALGLRALPRVSRSKEDG